MNSPLIAVPVFNKVSHLCNELGMPEGCSDTRWMTHPGHQPATVYGVDFHTSLPRGWVSDVYVGIIDHIYP